MDNALPPEHDDLPMFPAVAPTAFSNPTTTAAWFADALAALASIVSVEPEHVARPTPCAEFDVSALRDHVLGWLQFFAAALHDPDGNTARFDAGTWQLGPENPRWIVERAAAEIDLAIERGVADRIVVMVQARMRGDAVLAMALGEYLVHGWDLAIATNRPLSVDQDAAEAALEFLECTVAPEHRGPDNGFFDAAVAVDAEAHAFDRLLAFAGRTPQPTTASS